MLAGLTLCCFVYKVVGVGTVSRVTTRDEIGHIWDLYLCTPSLCPGRKEFYFA